MTAADSSPSASRVTAGGPPAEVGKKYVLPGRLFVTAEPYAVTTILGSCVAVCLWDPTRRAGGVNHFLLPHWAGARQSSARFGNLAMEQLIGETLALGSRLQDLQAKVFGGARVIDHPEGDAHHLGARNVEVAHQILVQEGIPIVAEDVGGKGGRKVIFHTLDGSVLLRRF